MCLLVLKREEGRTVKIKILLLTVFFSAFIGKFLVAMTDIVSPDYEPWKGREGKLITTINQQISNITNKMMELQDSMIQTKRVIRFLDENIGRLQSVLRISNRGSKRYATVCIRIEGLLALRRQKEGELHYQERRYNFLLRELLELSNLLPMIGQ